MSGKASRKLTQLFQQRPRAYDLVIRKKGDVGWRVGTLPFDSREDMLAHLRDHSAGQNSVYDLTDKDLSNADLSGADLSGAVLKNTDMSGANLAGANMSGITAEDSDFSNTRMIRTDISKSVIRNTPLEGATLKSIDAQGARLEQIGRVAKDLEDAFGGFYELNGRQLSPRGLLRGRNGPRPGY